MVNPGHGISLAWGLTKDRTPTVFFPYQSLSSDPVPYPNRLLSAMDIDQDGLIELIFYWTDNHYRKYSIWQGNEKGYKQIAEVSVWP